MARPRTGIERRIVRAARERFLLEGVDGASLRNIAASAGTNTGMIYYYFRTKDELFHSVVEEVYARFAANLEAVLQTPAPLEERLSRYFVRIGSMSEIEAATVRLVLREAMGSGPRLEWLEARFLDGHLGVVLRALREGVAADALRSDVPLPMLLAFVAGAGMLPQALRRLELGPLAAEPGPEGTASMAVRLVLDGARSRGRRPARARRPPNATSRSRRAR